MTENELRALISEGVDVALAFDTNAIFGNDARDPFIQLCNTINRLNRIRKPRRIRKVVSAPVYMEKLHDLRQGHRNYDHQKIEQFLEEKEIDVMPFLEAHAEHVAGLLGELFPKTETWREFKRKQCLSCLGLGHLAGEVNRNRKPCGATIDWLVAGHADAEGHVLVTSDRDPEFQRVRRKAKLETVVKVVDEILRATAEHP